MEYLLGIDIGTSACKTAIFDREGNVVSSASGEYRVYYPHSGWAEQQPEEWWDAVCRSTRECLDRSGIRPQQIVGIGIDGQSWSAIAVDKNGRVLCPTPIWMDNRSADICDRLSSQLGKERLLSLSGNPLTAPYTTGKIVWYRENRPDIYKDIYKILQSNSYIAYRLTGKMTQDPSQGYGLHCFDIRKNEWDYDTASDLGIPASFLPEIFACHTIIGSVTAQAAAQCGLCEGIPVAAGGVDSAAAALGAGAAVTGETQEQGGQSGGMSICADTCHPDPRLILCSHVVLGLWLLQGGTTGGGGVMRWIQKEFASYEAEHTADTGKNVLAQLDALAEKIRPGSDGLVFLPYMSGERTPIWDPNAKGVFYGMDFSKTRGHFIRAAMEGVAFSLRHNLDTAVQTGARVTSMRATGGCANSALWTQIKADVTGKIIEVPGSDNATNLGAAILAGVGVGMFGSFTDAVQKTVRVKKTYTPDSSVFPAYDHNYDIYLELYENLKNTMKK